MDFWADTGRSVYRPRFTMERLKRFSNFTHLPRLVAKRFRKFEGGVTVECDNTRNRGAH